MASALNIAEIERQSRDLIQEIKREVHLTRKKVVFQLFKDLVAATPVDTGRARAAWTISEGSPSDDVPPEGQDHYPSPDISNAVVALDEDKPFGVIWIVNNVVYIVALDDGHSGQAPAGMTSLALSNLNAIN